MRYLFLSLCIPSMLFSCCDFMLYHKGAYAVGRTMEFEADVSSNIIIFPKGNRFVSRLENNQVGASWVGKYAFMGMSTFETESLVDGFNEAGLSYGALWFPETVYSKNGTLGRRDRVSLIDLGNWLLSQFATCDEVRNALPTIEIEAFQLPDIGMIPPLHFAIHDKTGQSIVVEFINGEMEIHFNPVGVLTNAPSFKWHMKNLSNYINLTPENAEPMKFGEVVLYPTGQGTGMMGMPGDWTPPSRFVRMAFFSHFMQFGQDANALINGAVHLINTVDIPYGLVRDRKKKSYDYTQWACVKDLTNQVFYYRTYQDLNVKKIDLRAEMRKLGKTIHKIPLEGISP